MSVELVDFIEIGVRKGSKKGRFGDAVIRYASMELCTHLINS